MPPKSAKAKNKRPLQEGDENQRQTRAHKSATTQEPEAEEPEEPEEPKEPQEQLQEQSQEQPQEEHGQAAQTEQAARKRRIPRGPKGEYFMPQFMPCECADQIGKIPMPSRWVAVIDATPGREMTLTSREWWEDHEPWLKAHKARLKLKAADWNKKEEAMKKDSSVPEDEGADDWDFVCRMRPKSERSYEKDDDEDDEEDSEDDEAEGEDKGPKPYSKFASLHPEWPWFFTMKGEDRGKWWVQEALKRDQDDFDMHFYNDFTWYGALEVIENIFAQFSDVLKSKATYRDIWPEVEGLALALRSNNLEFAMCDDSERCAKVIELVGYLAITVIDALKKENVFTPDSDIRNLGLVLCLLMRWGWEQHTSYDFEDENSSWVYKIIDMADEAGVKLVGPPKFDEELDQMRSQRAEKATKMNRWNSVNWTNKLKSYAPKTRLGGHRYDITKMSVAERKQYFVGGGGGFRML
ncbi:hypothetical protein FZEAL_2492 [Fusarium zealandicum]|uniref:Uncharacterized protein n=1 Tax=Fusarium zealandicum TaxID=1053134 RepID=A0A8H4UQK8_9HYPO|nr:hypothetical protein FZEAL_2492 [Fusarium zealandicum]